MLTTLRPQQLALDESAVSNRTSAPLITAIPRDQMPEDMRSAFLPEDIILLCEPSRSSSIANQTLAQARQWRRDISLLRRKCLWCTVDAVCAGIIVTFATLASLGAASIQNKETLGFYIFTYTHFISSATILLPTFILLYVHHGTKVHDGANLFCSQGVKLHARTNSAGSLGLFLLCSTFYIEHIKIGSGGG